ncbi:hypothetical protein GO755_00675 [Spirosoma sp. HMF4905]|uniref:Uncharacterized protein n=1 Tax=Spirosoma arboris TaxID=2682092 RepID=A0A7K1S482_9BACT|nr:hypothetical protein [Spirosoma arboris]MVM28525.1 hypothetical protein [Spirosoma arboris]
MTIALTEEIRQLNAKIQHMSNQKGLTELAKAYAQLQKLVDKLRQIDENNPHYLIAWNLLVYYSKADFRAMQLYYANIRKEKPSSLAEADYEQAFDRFKRQLDLAISLLP